MNAVTFDTLAFAKRLQEAGVPIAQAEAHANAHADFLTHQLLSDVATKTDLQALRTDTKADLQALRTDTKADLAELETRLTMRIMKVAAWQFVGLAGLLTMFKFIG